MVPLTLVEVAVETLARAERAVEDGAHRLELCANLSEGGLTPPPTLVRAVKAAVGVPVHVLIRPRAGPFVYDAAERAQMCDAVRASRDVGADAVVVGALTTSGDVDGAAIEALREAAGALPLVAHRAVDGARDVAAAVEAMASFGAARVLTSGGAKTAAEGVATLAELVRRFAGRVQVLAGGSIRAANARHVVDATGVREIHLGFPQDAEADRVRALVAVLGARR